MHRSGTSALGGALQALGLSVGKTVMPPSQEMGNPRGYYENLALVNVHDQFLSQIRRLWLNPRPIRPHRFLGSIPRRCRQELLQTLIQEFGSSRPLIKDPRLCELLPIWRPLIKKYFPQAAFILPIRAPMEVASSLRKRDNISLHHGLSLWTLHVLESERGSRGFRRFFTTYEKLLLSPLDTVAGLARDLGLPTEGVAAAVENQIDPSLRHHAEIPWPEDEPHRDLVLSVYQTVIGNGPDFEAKMDRLRRQYFRARKFRWWRKYPRGD